MCLIQPFHCILFQQFFFLISVTAFPIIPMFKCTSVTMCFYGSHWRRPLAMVSVCAFSNEFNHVLSKKTNLLGRAFIPRLLESRLIWGPYPLTTPALQNGTSCFIISACWGICFPVTVLTSWMAFGWTVIGGNNWLSCFLICVGKWKRCLQPL